MSSYQKDRDYTLSFFTKVSLLSNRNENEIWRVRHKNTEQDYVLRFLKKPNNVYETLCNVRCDNLPAVYEVLSYEDGMIVLEEYIDGITVSEVAQSGRYQKRGAKKIIREVCNAMNALHGCGVIHRDIKPENIMVSPKGRVVLIDFGASRRISQKSRDTEIIGTVGYVSPEQLGLKESDERTDIYATGVLYNVLLTGKHPTECIATGKEGRIIRKCTAVNPSERYRTAKKLFEAL